MDPSTATTPEALLRNAEWVRRLARSLTSDAATAHDVEQETWVAALEQARRSRGLRVGAGSAPTDSAHPIEDARQADPPPAAWFARVLSNFALRTRRTRARVAEREQRAARPEAQPSTAEVCERAELHRALVDHVLALDEPYKTTLLLRYFEALTPSAIAARDGVPVRTVNTRLARGHEKLRERLDRASGGDRSRWLSALLGFVEVPAGRDAFLLEVFLMQANAKLAIGVVLLGLGVAVWFATRDSGPEPEPLLAAPTARIEVPAADAPTIATQVQAEPRTPAAAAVPAFDPSTNSANDGASLRGRAVTERGAPVAGARVRLTPAVYNDFAWSAAPKPIATAETDSTGAFSFVLAPAQYGDVEVRAAGFGTARVLRRHGGEDVTITLLPEGVLHGRVLVRAPGTSSAGATSSPATGARVVLRGTENAGSNPSLAECTSDAEGRYRLEGLAARDYWLSASAPGAASTSGFRTVAIAAGSTSELDVELEGLATTTLRGRVVEAAGGLPIARAKVTHSTDVTTETDAQGAFVLEGVAIGPRSPARISVSADSHAPADRLVAANAAAATVEITLARERTVLGRIVGPAGEPVGGASVVLLAAKSAPKGVADTRTGETGDDGRFAVPGLRADIRHTLLVRAAGFATRAIELAEDELASARFDAGVVELGLASVIAGRVLDDTGAPWLPARVELVAVGALASGAGVVAAPSLSQRSMTSDGSGRFAFGDLSAGEYELRVRAHGGADLNVVPVSVAAAETRTTADIVIPLGRVISGRVLAPDGSPCAGVWVQAYAEAGPPDLAGSANTESDGRFRISGLASGSYTLRSKLSPVAPAEVVVIVANGRWTAVAAGTTGLELALPRVAPITGRVVGADGTPIANALVEAIGGARLGEPDGFSKTDATGAFRLPVGEGAVVDVVAKSPRPAPPAPGSAAAFEEKRAGVTAGTKDLEIRVAPR